MALPGIADSLQAAAPKALGATLWRFQAPLLEAFTLMPLFTLSHVVSAQPTAWCLSAEASCVGSGAPRHPETGKSTP